MRLEPRLVRDDIRELPRSVVDQEVSSGDEGLDRDAGRTTFRVVALDLESRPDSAPPARGRDEEAELAREDTPADGNDAPACLPDWNTRSAAETSRGAPIGVRQIQTEQSAGQAE